MMKKEAKEWYKSTVYEDENQKIEKADSKTDRTEDMIDLYGKVKKTYYSSCSD